MTAVALQEGHSRKSQAVRGVKGYLEYFFPAVSEDPDTVSPVPAFYFTKLGMGTRRGR